MSRDGPGLLLRDVLGGKDPQVDAVANIIAHADADVLVLAGIDWDLEGHALNALAEVIGGYPHRFSARPNRGLASGADLDGDGQSDDVFGYGEFAGQNGLAVISRLPIAVERVREFTDLLWRELPGALIPAGGDAGARLSTTAHWDVPVLTDAGAVHLLIWHATPPVFDGPEDRNGRRNHDEAAFWFWYLDGALGAAPDRFVLTGAANLDPAEVEGRPDALRRLLADTRVQDPKPRGAGGELTAKTDGGVNRRHMGDAGLDTVDWPDDGEWPGNLRVDYVLPSATLKVTASGVVWPPPDTPLGQMAVAASRHRLVWVDLELPAH